YYLGAMSLEKTIEGAIQEAMAAGAFSNLPGAGKPLPSSREQQAYAGENWLGYKMLESGGYVPEWLNLGREIEIDLEKLAVLDRNHQEFCDGVASPGDWARVGPAVDRLRAKYEERAREIRKKQDRYNFDAPGHRTQRPGIWVEHQVERLRARESAAGRE
ncbi:MAG: DnaJ family domain-containing protein, partial [bacterium]